MSLLVALIVWSAVTYRISRFVIMDTIWEGTRDRLVDRLEQSDRLLPRKTIDWIGCPYCVTPWVAAGVLATHRVFVGPFPEPVWAWLAVATGALVFWAITDSE
jgi:hypothetical protein